MKHIFILLMLLWDNVEFTLTEKECRELPTFERGFVPDEYKKAEYQRGDVIYFSCDPGYTTGLNASYICTEHGWRAATFGQCIEDTFPVRLGCAPPPPLKNGNPLKNAYFYRDGERVRFKCDLLYELKGGLHKTCTNGQWTGDLECVALLCTKPLIENGEVQEDKEEYTLNDVLTFSCDPGYKKVKDESSVCLRVDSSAAPQWSPIPQCEVIDCGDPEPLLNGGVSFLSGELNQYGSVVQYHCDEPYYSLSGAVNVSFSCEADGKWKAFDDTGLIPTCVPVCGKPRVELSGIQRIIGGTPAPHGSIPWQVHFPNGAGMLIADRWVLTAAQNLCPYMRPIPLDSIKMFWGKNTRDDSQVPNAIAASVHLHPGYNNSENLNFDNDIALIKLPEPVTFNKFVMPICLPSEENTLQDGIMGVVSGFGVTASGASRVSKKLNYVRLPVVNWGHCNESLKTILQRIPQESHNMFCAGFPEGGKDPCMGDAGGPFALWSRDHYWVAGIVSWGVGCADKGQYGFYTKVSNYVDWIHKTMKEN